MGERERERGRGRGGRGGRKEREGESSNSSNSISSSSSVAVAVVIVIVAGSYFKGILVAYFFAFEIVFLPCANYLRDYCTTTTTSKRALLRYKGGLYYDIQQGSTTI